MTDPTENRTEMTAEDFQAAMAAASELSETAPDPGDAEPTPEQPKQPEPTPKPEPEPEAASDPESEPDDEGETDPEPPAEPQDEPLSDDLIRAQHRAKIADEDLSALPAPARRKLLQRLSDEYREKDRLAGIVGSQHQAPKPKQPEPESKPEDDPFPIVDIKALKAEYAEEFGDATAERMIRAAEAQNRTNQILNQQFRQQRQQQAQQQQMALQQTEQTIESFFGDKSDRYGQGPTMAVDPQKQQTRIRVVQTAMFALQNGRAQSWDEALQFADRFEFPEQATPPPESKVDDGKKAEIREKRKAASTPRPQPPEGGETQLDPIDEIVASMPDSLR